MSKNPIDAAQAEPITIDAIRSGLQNISTREGTFNFLSNAGRWIKFLLNSYDSQRAEIDEFEKTDLVPRSRYNAADAESREAREQVSKLAQRAAIEIQRLETANNTLQAELTGLRKAAQAALTNIQGMLDGNDLPSMVIRDMLRAALHPQPEEMR